MLFRTEVEIGRAPFEVQPCEEMLFVGSCFANEIGRRFEEEGFPVTINPYGTMYNPASILHTLQRWLPQQSHEGRERLVVFLTLGTNHVYRLKETGEIVDNCEKRPAALFQEEELSIEACADYLQQAVTLLQSYYPAVQVALTVSPIRYRKYGYHESQLSKATLLLAIQRVVSSTSETSIISYFPAYEIVLDELRDYRFYAPDMLHPSQQAVDFLWERLVAWCFSADSREYLREWQPLKQALGHRPFDPESKEYRALMDKTMLKVAELRKKYRTFGSRK